MNPCKIINFVGIHGYFADYIAFSHDFRFNREIHISLEITMNLKTAFIKAQQDVKKLPSKPSNDVLLQLYAFYKQATSGDVSGKRPGMMDIAGRAKFDAWTKLQGMDEAKAMEGYISLVKTLLSA